MNRRHLLTGLVAEPVAIGCDGEDRKLYTRHEKIVGGGIVICALFGAILFYFLTDKK
jgi:hypothetical protein